MTEPKEITPKLVRMPADLARDVADYLHKRKQAGNVPRSELSENTFFIKAIKFYLHHRRTHDIETL